MSGESFLFTVFALATCLSAVAVVVSQTVVRMAFWLIITLGSTAALFFLPPAPPPQPPSAPAIPRDPYPCWDETNG